MFLSFISLSDCVFFSVFFSLSSCLSLSLFFSVFQYLPLYLYLYLLHSAFAFLSLFIFFFLYSYINVCMLGSFLSPPVEPIILWCVVAILKKLAQIPQKRERDTSKFVWTNTQAIYLSHISPIPGLPDLALKKAKSAKFGLFETVCQK